MKRLELIYCAIALLGTTGFGADAAPAAEPPPESIALWSGPAPVGDGTTDPDATSTCPGLTVYRPEKGNGTVVVICPGGGYGGVGVTGAEGTRTAKWLNQYGIVGVVLNYRLPKGRSMVPLLDAQRAIRTVRFKAQDWGCDPHRLGIIGYSAGGHLASTAATHFDEGNPKATDPIDKVGCRPDFALLVYPVISMGELAHQGSKKNLLGAEPTPQVVEWFSNEKQITKNTPPTFITHASDDKVVVPDNSRQYHAALLAHGVDSHYLELPSGGHGLNGYKGPMWDAWLADAVQWLTSRGLAQLPK